MANVCPCGPLAPNEPTTTSGITVTPNVPQPIYSSNGGPLPEVDWNFADEFCSLQLEFTPGNEMIVPETAWAVQWKNLDASNGVDATLNPGLAAGFGVAPGSGTPVTGPATSGPVVIGTNTLTVTIVSGTVRVSDGSGSLFAYHAGDPVSGAVVKYEWANPVHGLQHIYQTSGSDQTPTGVTNYQTAASCPPAAATATCLPANGTTDVSTNLNGSFTGADPGDPSLWDFKFGTTPGGPYPLSSGQVVATAANQTVNVFVGGLTPGTQYYYTLVLYQSDGTTVIATSSECSFTTIGPTCGAATAVTTNSATLNGTTLGVPAGGYKYQFRYGITNGGPYTTVIGPFPAATGGPTPISQPTGAVLTPATPYYFVVDILDPGNVVVATSTPNCPFVTATPAPVRTAACANGTNVDSNSADLHGTLGNIQAGDQYRYRYGTTFGGPYPFGALALFPAANGPVTNNTGNVLTPGSTYFFIVEVLDSSNVVQATSSECNFITQGAQFNVTDPPSAVTDSSANLNGRAFNTEPGDTMEFIWGSTPGGPYPNLACPGQPTTQVANPDGASCPIAGLLPSTQYCYRLIVRNSLNVVTTTGNEVCFTTAAPPPPLVSTDPATGITNDCMVLHGSAALTQPGCTNSFIYGDSPGGPYDHTIAGNPAVSPGGNEAFSATVCGLGPNHTIYYKAVVTCGPTITQGPEANAATADGVYWCGGLHDPNECNFVPSNQGGYFNCNQT